MIWLSFLVLIGYILSCKYWKHLQFWRRKCVTYSTPVPFFGSLLSVVFRKKSFSDKIKELYEEFPHHRYNGIFELSQPMLLVRDKELLQDIFVKNFDHFADRNIDVDEYVDNLLSRNLYFSKQKNWCRIRPCTEIDLTGLPREILFSTVKNSIENITDHLQKDATKVQHPVNFEAIELFRRITNDIIAASVFGYKSNSFENKNDEFFKMSQKLIKLEAAASFKIFLNNLLPLFKKFFRKFHLYSSEPVQFFRTLIFNNKVTDTQPKEHLAPFLIERLKTESNGKLSDDDILAQVLSFLTVGYEPLAICMSFLAYELAVNVHVQKKIQKEIDDVLYRSTDDITYDGFSKINYLDALVLETLRKWPSVAQIERKCTKDYILAVGKSKECGIRVEKGDVVLIPVYGFHHDPNYFPAPEKFDPDRFLNTDLNIVLNFTNYFPFGVGHRKCVAMEFSMLIIKIIFFDLISKFEFIATMETAVPLETSKRSNHLFPQNGIFLGLRARK